MKIELFYPVKPLGVNQGFGVNGQYYQKFLDSNGNPLKGHNGVDLMAAHGTPLYAPCDGVAMYNKDEHGGDGLIVNTVKPFGYEGGTNILNIILWHLCPKDDPKFPIQIPCDGNWHAVKVGDLLGYTDNSGAPYESSGDHLHFGLVPLLDTWQVLNPGNGFGGCIDPMPYFNGKFAQDFAAEVATVSSVSQVIQEISKSNLSDNEKSNFLLKVAQFLKWLLNKI